MVDLHPEWFPRDEKEFEVAFLALYKAGTPTKSQAESMAAALRRHRYEGEKEARVEAAIENAVACIYMVASTLVSCSGNGYDSRIEDQCKLGLTRALRELVRAIR